LSTDTRNCVVWTVSYLAHLA